MPTEYQTDAHACCVNTLYTIERASKIMRETGRPLLPVVEQQMLVGVIIDRDIVTKVVANGTDSFLLRVSDCMRPREEWEQFLEDSAGDLSPLRGTLELPDCDDAGRFRCMKPASNGRGQAHDGECFADVHFDSEGVLTRA